MDQALYTRAYYPGMGEAVANRTVNRKVFTDEQKALLPETIHLNPKDPLLQSWLTAASMSDWPVQIESEAPLQSGKPETRMETWGEVALRVTLGSTSLAPEEDREYEHEIMEKHLRQASLLMSGRHLQHGDKNQAGRNLEIYTNCSTSATSFLLFYLLLNGSGVGRAYDDRLIRADLNQMPIVVCTLDWSHPDVAAGHATGYLTRRDAEHLYAHREITVFEVPDSREGWAKGVEVIERMAFENRREEVLILDFTGVRERNAPIMGMQGRPASGPGPLMAAITAVSKLRDAAMAPWRAAMYADHYLAECVLVGGARRAARMATKNWRDTTIFDFINLKRGGFLWSSNNSVIVDEEFREGVKHVWRKYGNALLQMPEGVLRPFLDLEVASERIEFMEGHAFKVFVALARAAYFDKTGEPAIINQDRLTQIDDGFDGYQDGLYASSAKFQCDAETIPLMKKLAEAVYFMRYQMITNPCGEICLLILGAYCTIADVVPFQAGAWMSGHAGSLMGHNSGPALDMEVWDDDVEEAFRCATRALIRTNTMDCLYRREVARTNRIGVGFTGIHEWIYSRFGYTWHDIVDENRSLPMWLMLSRFKRAIVDEAKAYSQKLGVTVPHTNTTVKPAGTTSKLFGLSEGAHLPAMREYLRWVQFRHDDPLVADYEKRGFPIKHLKSYSGTTIVGFPTKPAICDIGTGDWVVTAAEATPEEQYRYLELLERYWIRGVAEDGMTPLEESGNQVSYTLKYKPEEVSFEQFVETMIAGQFRIRCCSVMPQEDKSAYEYLPESPVSKLEFEQIAAAIDADDVKEEVDFAHVDCAGGACPIDFNSEKADVDLVAAE